MSGEPPTADRAAAGTGAHAAPAPLPPPGRRRRWRPHSLKGSLLLWLVPGLMLIMGASVLWSLQYLRTQVDIAHDRALIGALRAIDYNTSTASGGLAVEQPYLLLEFFELTVEGTVYFRCLLYTSDAADE